MPYEIVLVLHSWLRWAVVLLAFVALARSLRGWLGRHDFTGTDHRTVRLFVAACDMQLLLGLVLYFWLSPITPKSIAALKAGMKVASLRFFAVEHLAMMLAVIVLGHLAAISARKAGTPTARHKRLTIYFGVIVALIAVGVPWPWTTNVRPLFRMMAGG